MQQITVGQLGFRERERKGEKRRERERERERGRGVAFLRSLKWSKYVERMIYEMLVKTCSDLFATVNWLCLQIQLRCLCRLHCQSHQLHWTLHRWGLHRCLLKLSHSEKLGGIWFLDEGWSWRRHEYGQMQQITVGQLGFREREREGWHCFEVRSDQNMLREWYMRCWWRPVQICLPLSIDSACRFSWGAYAGYTVRATSFTGTSTDEGCTGACRSWVIVKSLEVWFLDEGGSSRRHEYGQMQQITVGQLGLRERERKGQKARERGRERERGDIVKICWENDIWDVGEDLFICLPLSIDVACRFSWGAYAGYTVRATSFTGTSTDEGCTGACWSWVIVKSLEVWFLDEGWSSRRHEYGQMQQITVGQLGFREREREKGREREREKREREKETEGWHCFEVRSDQNMLREWYMRCWWRPVQICLPLSIDFACRFSWGAYAGYTVRATSFTGTSTDEGCTGACRSWVIVKSLEVWFLDEGRSSKRHEYGQMQQITMGQLGFRKRERERRGVALLWSSKWPKREWYMICWWRPVQICLPLSIDVACRFSWGAHAGYTVRATSFTGTSTDEGCTGACRSWVIVKSLEVWFLDEGRSSRQSCKQGCRVCEIQRWTYDADTRRWWRPAQDMSPLLCHCWRTH